MAAPAPRSDRALATRARILVAAHAAFAEHGFEASGVREIAASAGVNPALVIRHFGSKEQLFVEAIGEDAAWGDILEGPLEQIGARAVRAVLAGHRHGLRAFGAMLRASGRPDIRATLQRSVERQLWEPLTAALTGPGADLRAHLFCAQLTGLMVALAVYDDEVLMRASVDEVVALYGRALQDLVEPDAALLALRSSASARAVEGGRVAER